MMELNKKHPHYEKLKAFLELSADERIKRYKQNPDKCPVCGSFKIYYQKKGKVEYSVVRGRQCWDCHLYFVEYSKLTDIGVME